MPDEPFYRKTPSAADLMRKRAEGGLTCGFVGRIVERWKAERSPLWSPTIRCAITAGTPWLDVYCPGCRTPRAIDIRTLDRHPLASVGSLVIGLRCSCCPSSVAPMPILTGLHALPPVARWSKSVMPMEFLHGRPLSPEELEMIRRELESLDNIGSVDEVRGIVAHNWPHLLAKLPPEED
jgi:hypothetical protein